MLCGLFDVENRTDWHAGLMNGFEPVLRGRLFQRGLHLLLQGVVVLESVRVRKESLICCELGPAECVAEQSEQVVVTGADHKMAIRRLEHVKGWTCLEKVESSFEKASA